MGRDDEKPVTVDSIMADVERYVSRAFVNGMLVGLSIAVVIGLVAGIVLF